MTEILHKEVIESYFFKAPVYVDGVFQPAPQNAIETRDNLRKNWLPTVEVGKGEVPVVKLSPVFKTEPPGWKVETAIVYKPDTTANKNPIQNN